MFPPSLETTARFRNDENVVGKKKAVGAAPRLKSVCSSRPVYGQTRSPFPRHHHQNVSRSLRICLFPLEIKPLLLFFQSTCQVFFLIFSSFGLNSSGVVSQK